jgi:hypothetical protein
MRPGRAAGRNPLIIKHLHKTAFKKRAKSAKNYKKTSTKIIYRIAKKSLAFWAFAGIL